MATFLGKHLKKSSGIWHTGKCYFTKKTCFWVSGREIWWL